MNNKTKAKNIIKKYGVRTILSDHHYEHGARVIIYGERKIPSATDGYIGNYDREDLAVWDKLDEKK